MSWLSRTVEKLHFRVFFLEFGDCVVRHFREGQLDFPQVR